MRLTVLGAAPRAMTSIGVLLVVRLHRCTWLTETLSLFRIAVIPVSVLGPLVSTRCRQQVVGMVAWVVRGWVSAMVGRLKIGRCMFWVTLMTLDTIVSVAGFVFVFVLCSMTRLMVLFLTIITPALFLSRFSGSLVGIR